MEKGCFGSGVITSDRAQRGRTKEIAMPTLNQLIRHGREEKRRTDRTRALDQCPQKEGVCPRVSTRTPKKPNSALRKIAKVQLTNKHDIFAHIPGEGHNSQEHSKGFVGNSGSKKRQIKIWCGKTKIDMNGRCLWNFFFRFPTREEACLKCTFCSIGHPCAFIDVVDWRQPYIEYLTKGTLPDDRYEANKLKKMAVYRDEAMEVMHQSHAGTLAEHQGGRNPENDARGFPPQLHTTLQSGDRGQTFCPTVFSRQPALARVP
ncbi:ribosomal protein S12 [Striga asiatica]|uniref:Ribosomal protein S12 n=1 Tax=Striga asiatica TaxID=4170 RepID=A0A5A7Q2J0_STRAF|nr:ribosomal protein S12 [Striga asiatica]